MKPRLVRDGQDVISNGDLACEGNKYQNAGECASGKRKQAE